MADIKMDFNGNVNIEKMFDVVKNSKKENNVSEKYLPLQRFNKQMIVLQI